MNLRAIILLCLLLPVAIAKAERQTLTGVCETTWPGVRYHLSWVKRIGENRLLVALKIVAAPDAPKAGTFIGVKVPIPRDATPEDIASGVYNPLPFELTSSILIDEQKQRHPALAPLLTGPQYTQGRMIGTLLPGDAEIMTVQFAEPPLPSDAAPSRPRKFLVHLTNAKEAISFTLKPEAEKASPEKKN